MVFGWPSRDAEPVFLKTPGRFVRCFPLEFPMGVADLYDPRPRPVSVDEYVQHLLRYRGGQFVNGERGHRVLWALVNTALVHEMSGKGYVVHKMFMRRVGFRLEGGQSLRVRDLRQLVGGGGHSASLVNQLMCVGRSVRSTPM